MFSVSSLLENIITIKMGEVAAIGLEDGITVLGTEFFCHRILNKKTRLEDSQSYEKHSSISKLLSRKFNYRGKIPKKALPLPDIAA